ncbi:MAG: Ldh family oxidoreductase [Candidatus Omnitrophica bacterium]|nr:Ldh family oxidoreductase [Candidatus Omnitrophota bacterium]
MNQTTTTISVAELEQFCLTVLRQCGLNETDARITTDVLVTTDTFGVFTHGVKALRYYVRRLRAGGLRAAAVPQVVMEGPAWAVVDGQSAMGMVTSVFAMNTAIHKARTAGLAYVGVRNSCHFAAAGYYANLAAKADMIGMAMANDCPGMTVPGARKPVLGTNPIAFAIPTGKEHPVFLDIASSAVAGGKLRVAQAQGKSIPSNWLVDTEGMPTTDPFAYPHAGALLPFAGHKGYGFAVLIETLSALMTGAAVMAQVGSWMETDPTQPTSHGAAFLAFNIGAIMPIATFKQRMDKMIADIHQAPKAKNAERIYLPGEMEWENRRKALSQGLELPADVLDSLRILADDMGLKPAWLMN